MTAELGQRLISGPLKSPGGGEPNALEERRDTQTRVILLTRRIVGERRRERGQGSDVRKQSPSLDERQRAVDLSIQSTDATDEIMRGIANVVAQMTRSEASVDFGIIVLGNLFIVVGQHRIA